MNPIHYHNIPAQQKANEEQVKESEINLAYIEKTTLVGSQLLTENKITQPKSDPIPINEKKKVNVPSVWPDIYFGE